MAKGKYALRARSKHDADERYSAARAEADRLRSRLSEIQRLRAEREVMLAEIRHLKRLVADGTTDTLEQTRAELADLKRRHEMHREGTRDAFGDMGEVFGELVRALPKTSHAEYWDRFVQITQVICKGSEFKFWSKGMPAGWKRAMTKRMI